MDRRSLLIGFASALAAPAIVKAENIMRVRALRETVPYLIPYLPPSSDAMQSVYALQVAMSEMVRHQLRDLALFGATYTREAPGTLLGIERVDPRSVSLHAS